VLAELPATGQVLDYGCGHGLGALLAAERGADVLGVDVDANKVAAGRVAALALAERHRRGTDGGDAPIGKVRFAHIRSGWVPDPNERFDAVLLCDVLYLVPPSERLTLLLSLATRLKPGGRLVVKEVRPTTGPRYLVAAGTEILATRILRYTKGSFYGLVEARHLVTGLSAAGYATRIASLGGFYPHAHQLLVVTDALTSEGATADSTRP
jgi:2-polyprenyl-3-methyl-5-hydroxy-6-metoxy-1,4-benzoquinol methylase